MDDAWMNIYDAYGKVRWLGWQAPQINIWTQSKEKSIFI